MQTYVKLHTTQQKKIIQKKFLELENQPIYLTKREIKKINLIYEEIIKIIKEEVLNPLFQDKIIETIKRNLFRPIFISGINQIDISITESIKKIIEENFCSVIAKKISSIATDSPKVDLLIKHLSLNLENKIKKELISSQKKVSREKINIIVFDNGQNTELTNNPNLLSIKDMTYLQKIIDLSNTRV